SSAEIFSAAAERSIAAGRGYALAGGRRARHRCAALPADRTFGSTSHSSTGAAAASTPKRGEADTLGNRRHRTPGAVARHVLSTRSCRTIDAATTRRTFGALLRRRAGRAEWFVRSCLGARGWCRRYRWRDRLSFRSAGDISV